MNCPNAPKTNPYFKLWPINIFLCIYIFFSIGESLK